MRKKQRSPHFAGHLEHLELRRLLSTIYVDAIAPGPTHNGSSWADAYTDLQLALSAATSGTTIEVGQGTYKPTSGTDRTISYQLKTGVTLQGGYAGYGQANPDARNVSSYVTILSGDIGTIGTTTDNSYHVVVGSGTTSTAVLDGFTITAGNANSSSGTFAFGGGMFTASGSPTVNNCTFTANLGTDNAAMENSAAPVTVTGCTFSSNGPLAPSSSLVAGIENDGSAATINNCTFIGNFSTALQNNSSNSTITNCTFTQNDGSPLINMSSSPTITACTFDGNVSGSSGGAMYNSGGSPTILNCIFVDNETQPSSSFYGGAIYNGSSATVSIVNCTFTDNLASGYGGAVFESSSTVNVYNCILWNDSAPFGAETYASAGTLLLTGSDNGNVNPLFIQAPSAGLDGVRFTLDDNFGNVNIESWSPVVDAGSNSVLPTGLTTDFAGNPRRTDIPTVNNTGQGTSPIVDKGAYEAVPGLLSSPGGPYVVLQGQSTTLTGNGVGTVAGNLTYAWDFTDNGLFNSSTTQNPVFATTGLSLGSHIISLKVTDAGGHSIIASTTVTVVPPTIYVDRRASSGAQTGYDWADALPDLASALNAAISGQTIKVATGTYYPTTGTSRSVSFYMKSGVTVAGGYAGYGASNPDLRDFVNDATVLSGDIGTAGVNTDNSNSVVLSNNASSATLDGFTITGGYDALDGGGINIVSGGLTISNCTITSNYGVYGGGLYVGKFAAASVSNCGFLNDTASDSGGVYTDTSSTSTFTNCQFSGELGAAVYNNTSSTTTFSACAFTGNIFGSIYNYGATNTVINTSFTLNANTTPNVSSGGGILNTQSAISTITDCSFSGNTNYAVENTSSSCSISNSIFIGNTGADGAIENTSTSAKIINCTFVDNTATAASTGVGGALSLFSASSPSVANCIFWNNSSLYGTQIYSASAVIASIRYDDVQGGFSGTGNLNAIPLFIDTPNPGPDGKWNTSDDHYGNVAISAASPVVDQGSTAAILPGITTDLAGNPRQQDMPTTPNGNNGFVDMGAYEAAPALAVGTSGPYDVLQNQSLTLNGYGASNVSGALQYAWDWSGSGLFTDSNVANPVFPIGSFPVGSTINVALRVTDAGGHNIVSTSTVFIAPLIVDVDAAVVGGNGSGADWADAASNLQTVLTNALPGETFHVAGGTYLPATNSDRTASFNLRNNIPLYGGYAGSADPSAPDTRNVSQYQTILSGDIGISGNSADNSYHVVVANYVTSTAILDGFTISGGDANGTSTQTYSDGGGIYLSQSVPTINDCNFVSNYAAESGGGIYLPLYSPALTITDCSFTSNQSVANGGAIGTSATTLTLVDCSFTSNSAPTAGGAAIATSSSTVIATDCTFKQNTGSYDGAVAGTGVFTNCIFVGNKSTNTNTNYDSGGGAIDDETSADTITGCTFIGNSSGRFGGAILTSGDSPIISDCIFVDNSAQLGGAIGNMFSSSAKIADCTFTGNSASSNGGAVYNYYNAAITVVNSIFWGDTGASEIFNSTSSAAVTYTDISGSYAGTGNVNVNPQFIRAPGTNGSADYGDLHLQFTSPAIDAGNNAGIPAGITTDLDGNPRIFDFPGAHDPGAIVDMGAYELGTNLDAITVPARQTLSLPGSGYAFAVSQLTIGSGGTLDLGSDTLAVQYAAGSDPAASIASLLSSAFATGQWNGTGITSSLAVADTTSTTGVGYFDNGSQIVIGHTWYGDANLDGQINGDDLSLMLLGQTQNDTRWQDGDFTYHNQVNADDWMKLAYALAYSNGQSLPAFSTTASIQPADSGEIVAASSTKTVSPSFAQAPILSDEYLADLLTSPSLV